MSTDFFLSDKKAKLQVKQKLTSGKQDVRLSLDSWVWKPEILVDTSEDSSHETLRIILQVE